MLAQTYKEISLGYPAFQKSAVKKPYWTCKRVVFAFFIIYSIAISSFMAIFIAGLFFGK